MQFGIEPFVFFLEVLNVPIPAHPAKYVKGEKPYEQAHP
jgi:hypothetical protein